MKKLFVAIRQNDMDTVKDLLRKKPELINCTAKQPPKKDDGQSPLQIALKTRSYEIANYLISLGADVHFMDQARGDVLLNVLKNDSLKFYNEGKSYDLLQEFLKGLPMDILQKLLHDKDKWVKRVAIWIVSELGTIGENFIQDVNELVNDEDNYICSYALEIIANCARNEHMEDFKNIFLSLDSANPEIKISVMHIISNLSESRINDAYIYMASSVNSDDEHIKGLVALLNFNNHSESEIDDMIKNDNAITKKYGVIIAKKLYKKFPNFIGKSSNSDDYVICKFSKQVLETEKIFNEFMGN